MMIAKTLPVFAILILLSLRSAIEIEFQITPEKFKDNIEKWKYMLDNAANGNSNQDLKIYLKDIHDTDSNDVDEDNTRKLIEILKNTKLTKVTFCNLLEKDSDKRNDLRVIINSTPYDIKNNDPESNNLQKDLDGFCTKKKLENIPDIKNGITFNGTLDLDENKLHKIDIDDKISSLELYIESETNIAAVFKIRGNRRLLIL